MTTYSVVMTNEQVKALKRVIARHGEPISGPVLGLCMDGCIMVQVPSGMWLGIERDGHTHS